MLTEKILYIAEVMNRHEYVPKMPNQSYLSVVSVVCCQVEVSATS